MSVPVATLPLAPILHPVPQADADQRVVHGHQALGERRADVVLVLQRGRAGAALGAVDDDEVRASMPSSTIALQMREDVGAASRRTA